MNCVFIADRHIYKYVLGLCTDIQIYISICIRNMCFTKNHNQSGSMNFQLLKQIEIKKSILAKKLIVS